MGRNHTFIEEKFGSECVNGSLKGQYNGCFTELYRKEDRDEIERRYKSFRYNRLINYEKLTWEIMVDLIRGYQDSLIKENNGVNENTLIKLLKDTFLILNIRGGEIRLEIKLDADELNNILGYKKDERMEQDLAGVVGHLILNKELYWKTILHETLGYVTLTNRHFRNGERNVDLWEIVNKKIPKGFAEEIYHTHLIGRVHETNPLPMMPDNLTLFHDYDRWDISLNKLLYARKIYKMIARKFSFGRWHENSKEVWHFEATTGSGDFSLITHAGQVMYRLDSSLANVIQWKNISKSDLFYNLCKYSLKWVGLFPFEWKKLNKDTEDYEKILNSPRNICVDTCRAILPEGKVCPLIKSLNYCSSYYNYVDKK